MSLDALRKKIGIRTPSSETGYKKNSVIVYLPAEYGLTAEQWVQRFEEFSQKPKIKPAFAVDRYLNGIFPTTSSETCLEVSNVRWEDGRCLADLSFAKTKRGQALLVVFTNENLIPVAVCKPLDVGVGEIIHLSLSYVV